MARAVEGRIAARRAEVRAERRRARLRRTIGVTVTVMVVVGGFLVERSTLVALTTLEVAGIERLDQRAVLAAGDVRIGTSVLRLRTGRIEDDIESLALVDHATVRRDGPLGLRIEVVEVAPALTAVFGDTPWLVAADGLVLGPGDAPGTPHVTVTGRPPVEGEQVASRPALQAAHTVLLGLPGPIGALVDDARVRTADDVELILEGGAVVRWGDATRGDEKARALGAVLEDLGGRRVTAIDVRAPLAPTVTP